MTKRALGCIFYQFNFKEFIQMKKFFLSLLFAGILVGFCGCQSKVYSTGLYVPRNGGEEYIAVYNDLIFIHIRRPASMPGDKVFWDWAGKYEIAKNGEFVFDMSEEEYRDWNFHYIFRTYSKGGIRVENLGEMEKSYTLYKRPVQRRKVVPTEEGPEMEPMQ